MKKVYIQPQIQAIPLMAGNNLLAGSTTYYDEQNDSYSIGSFGDRVDGDEDL